MKYTLFKYYLYSVTSVSDTDKPIKLLSNMLEDSLNNTRAPGHVIKEYACHDVKHVIWLHFLS